jgi:hypothetical protein
LVRFDDLTGKNWTALTTIPTDVYAYNRSGVNGVAVLPTGKIIVSTAGNWTFRFDDMTGANAEAGEWRAPIAGISADPRERSTWLADSRPACHRFLTLFGHMDTHGSLRRHRDHGRLKRNARQRSTHRH